MAGDDTMSDAGAATGCFAGVRWASGIFNESAETGPALSNTANRAVDMIFFIIWFITVGNSPSRTFPKHTGGDFRYGLTV